MNTYPSGLPPEYTTQHTSEFWWSMAFFLIGSAVVIFLLNMLLRKMLGVERRKKFSNNYVNEKHQRIDWTIRMVAVFAIVVAAIFAFYSIQIYMFFIFIIFGAIQETVRAVMEKKHAKNPNDYLFTLIQFPLAILVIITLAYAAFPDVVGELLSA
ncbi:DUF4181 domain-containing protein [Planococcus ruber]|uniref:DUF4181 domain-containing protein n=1 Tax=Planococcus ruber TaxID=2027871 RepID=UPI001FEE4873|nr:DUF4181 domain-containing protein [Planococcus ruber]MCJ1907586.1 DUF4181 domain-containing protein [Planococcus ruber]